MKKVEYDNLATFQGSTIPSAPFDVALLGSANLI
jgi:hypothetical protein